MAICVFCGSSAGHDGAFAELAWKVGAQLAGAGIDVVYGGGHVGLMGRMADGALAADGKVVGVIPRSLVDRELAHRGLSALHIVDSMHARKAKMAELSDAFLALPGGVGTLEELFEQWTWAQLGIHAKPCGFLNVGGYFDPLNAMIERMIDNGFLLREHAEIVHFAADLDAMLIHFETARPVAEKWRGGADAQ